MDKNKHKCIENAFYKKFNLKDVAIKLSRCDDKLKNENNVAPCSSLQMKMPHMDVILTALPSQSFYLTTANCIGSLQSDRLEVNDNKQVHGYQLLVQNDLTEMDSNDVIMMDENTLIGTDEFSTVMLSLQQISDSNELYYLPVSFEDNFEDAEIRCDNKLAQQPRTFLSSSSPSLSKSQINENYTKSSIVVYNDKHASELLSTMSSKMGGESSSVSEISILNEINLQNDVMLGAEVTCGIINDDDNYVGELMNFLPIKTLDGYSEIVTDLSHTELGLEWNGDLAQDWNLDPSSTNEGGFVLEAEKLNEEFSKKMKEEYAASVIKNSLIQLKKKMTGVKPLKKIDGKDAEDDIGCKDYKNNNKTIKDVKMMKNDEREVMLRKRRLPTTDDDLKKVKNNVIDINKRYFPSTSSLSHKTKKILKEDKSNFEQKTSSVRQKTSPTITTCRGPHCTMNSQEDMVYCGPVCIEAHVLLSLKLLGDNGKTTSRDMNDRVVVLERRSGKLLTGPMAPTPSTLLSFIQKHPTYEVLQPKLSSTFRESINKRIPKTDVSRIQNKCTFLNTSKAAQQTTSQPLSSAKLKLKSNIDSMRIMIRKNFLQCLTSKMNETTMVTLSELKHLSIDIENELYKQYNSTNQIYQQHYLKLIKLLKKSSDEVLNGEESPCSLVKKAHMCSDDLLSYVDTTFKHDQHMYDINCLICNPSHKENKLNKPTVDKHESTKSNVLTTEVPSRTSSNVSELSSSVNVLSPDVTSTTDIDDQVSKCDNNKDNGNEKTKRKCRNKQNISSSLMSDEVKFQPNIGTSLLPLKLPPLPKIQSDSWMEKVWKGELYTKDLTAKNISAYRTSGSMNFIKELLPKSLSIMGRISYDVVEDYITKIKTTYSNSKEIAVICFNYVGDDDKKKSDFQSFFNCLNEKKRCAVIGSFGSSIKDMYIWPLTSSSPIPRILVPFNGPGLDVNRGDILLGIIIQQASTPPTTDNQSKPSNPSDDSIVMDPNKEDEIVKKFKKELESEQQDFQQQKLPYRLQNLSNANISTQELMDGTSLGKTINSNFKSNNIFNNMKHGELKLKLSNSEFVTKCNKLINGPSGSENEIAQSFLNKYPNHLIDLESIPLPSSHENFNSGNNDVNIDIEKNVTNVDDSINQSTDSHTRDNLEHSNVINDNEPEKDSYKENKCNDSTMNSNVCTQTSTNELLLSLNSLLENYIAVKKSVKPSEDIIVSTSNKVDSNFDCNITSHNENNKTDDNDNMSINTEASSALGTTGMPIDLLKCNISTEQRDLMKQALKLVQGKTSSIKNDNANIAEDNIKNTMLMSIADVHHGFEPESSNENAFCPPFIPLTIEYNHQPTIKQQIIHHNTPHCNQRDNYNVNLDCHMSLFRPTFNHQTPNHHPDYSTNQSWNYSSSHSQSYNQKYCNESSYQRNNFFQNNVANHNSNKNECYQTWRVDDKPTANRQINYERNYISNQRNQRNNYSYQKRNFNRSDYQRNIINQRNDINRKSMNQEYRNSSNRKWNMDN